MSQTEITMKSSSEYRLQARESLSGNWGKFALLYLIIGAASIGASFIPFLGSIAEFVLSGPIALGIVICMLKLLQDEPVALEDVLEGFRNFVPALLVYLLATIFTILWTLLFIIPGIIAGYRYSMCYYILRENPEMAPMDVIRQSKEMMKGHKMELFILHLTFIGWGLLSIITLGIGFLWLTPYVSASTTAFYLDLKGGQTAVWKDPGFVRDDSRGTDDSSRFTADSSRFANNGSRFLYEEPEPSASETPEPDSGSGDAKDAAPESPDSNTKSDSTFF